MQSNRQTRRRFIAIAGGGTLAGLAGCSGSSANSDPHSTDEAKPTDSTTDESPVVEMITDNLGSYFDPKGLLVAPGTTVRFVMASGSHRTTAYHPDNGDQPLRIPDGAQSWDSPLYTEQGKTFEVTFDVEGVYDYYCPPHETLGMVGRIVVGEPHDGPATKPPDELPPGAREALPETDVIVDQGSVAGP